jgi:hypothetical protein
VSTDGGASAIDDAGLIDETLGWIGKNPAAALTGFGLAAFAVVELALREFYRHFGTTPEAVGSSYAFALTEESGDLLAIFALLLAAVLVLRRSVSSARARIPQYDAELVSLTNEMAQAKTSGADSSKLESIAKKTKAIQKHRARAEVDVTGRSRVAALFLMVVPAVWAVVLLVDAFTSGTGPRTPSIVDPLQASVTKVSVVVGTSNPLFLRLHDSRKQSILLLGHAGAQYVLYLEGPRPSTVYLPDTDAAVYESTRP